MTDVTVHKTRMIEGVWEGVIEGTLGDAPNIQVTHVERVIEGVEVTPEGKDKYRLRVTLPTTVLSDGVQSFVITNKETDTQIGSFVLLAGDALDDDIRAEVSLLRAELDMLKRAFRRHCVETA